MWFSTEVLEPGKVTLGRWRSPYGTEDQHLRRRVLDRVLDKSESIAPQDETLFCTADI